MGEDHCTESKIRPASGAAYGGAAPGAFRARPVPGEGAGVHAPACPDTRGEFPPTRIAAARPVLSVDPDPPDWGRPYLAGHLAADPAGGAGGGREVPGYAARCAVGGAPARSAGRLAGAARIAGRPGSPGPPYGTAAVRADPVAPRPLPAGGPGAGPPSPDRRTGG